MIEIVKGDIFKSECEALVNPVNLDGISGKGLALEFKHRYPVNFANYRRACAEKWLVAGTVFRTWENGKCIINFPTKRHWQEKSYYGLITSGLGALLEDLQATNIKSVAVPALGCGLGGLNWNDVLALIESRLDGDKLPGVLVKVYPPK
jgi:O-acetyl-ADP-ribose deacetylase (regulator of RNase III)